MTAAGHELHAPVPCPACGDTVPAALLQVAAAGALQLHAGTPCTCGAPPPAVEVLPDHPAYGQLTGWLAGLARTTAAEAAEGQ